MKYLFRYTMVVVYTLFWGVIGVPMALLDRSGRLALWVGRNWIRWILFTCGIRVEASGLEHVDLQGPQIFMSNHQSVMDIAAIFRCLPVPFRFVMKKEVLRIPFVGWIAGGGGHIPIDRFHRDRAMPKLDEAVRRIRSGTNLIYYPEGTRSESGELRPFKSGGFFLAIQAGVPVVPVSVSGSQHTTPKGSLRIESGTIRVVFGKPISTRGLSVEDRHQLKQLVRDGILEGFDPRLQANTHGA